MESLHFGGHRSPSSMEAVELSVGLPKIPSSDLRVLVAPECGSGGGCPTIYQVAEGGGIIVQGYPPRLVDNACVRVKAGESAVVIPRSFFGKVLERVLEMLPTDPPDDDSYRLYQWATGDVVIRGVPVTEERLFELKVPPGEVAIVVGLRSFWKMIGNVSVRNS
jgi:hypothetical protein